MQRSQHADGEERAAAAEVADQVERDHRILLADRVEGARDSDVGDVVTGRHLVGPVLAPTGHPPIYEPWIRRQCLLGPEAESLHHAGAESLDEDVALLRKNFSRTEEKNRSDSNERSCAIAMAGVIFPAALGSANIL